MKDYSMDDLIALTNYSARGIRHYIGLHMVPKPRLAGSATRYSRETLGKLSAIRTWRRDEKISINGIKRALRQLTEEQIEDWAYQLDPIDPPEATPPAATVQQAPAPVPLPPAPVVESVGALDGLEVGETWVELSLIPGLRLMLRSGSGEMTARVAKEIQKRYRVG